MASVLKYVDIDKLDDIVKKYNNSTYHSTIQMKPADVKSKKYIDFNVEKNDNMWI